MPRTRQRRASRVENGCTRMRRAGLGLRRRRRVIIAKLCNAEKEARSRTDVSPVHASTVSWLAKRQMACGTPDRAPHVHLQLAALPRSGAVSIETAEKVGHGGMVCVRRNANASLRALPFCVRWYWILEDVGASVDEGVQDADEPSGMQDREHGLGVGAKSEPSEPTLDPEAADMGRQGMIEY
ncbi:hypothetical protein A1Q1_00344 [Trichosporon asahii var. asahii CBS 2479]|uniref:Uncharacterized protein n=1 Tax=Trichosporon asahii var. asahii (strain ATCC 90039 / CBS 2479 / JCM 2466 / KCTC 7840 / NBRC 103889/ NCYC 2677 / UAMH 7654) TaxID=1186058 RepID=J5TD89_TRIAS|nr:hypothetical protein A1Q1_00344 [Trichosporon asahii var. asahii CBS 2479]EJT50366.1 hypothetical protein A1Q1_00344 [Trichosporon asahii var. asahii CBS 2479]